MSGKKLVLMALVVALAQIGVLSWAIFSRAAVLRDGREVLLKVEPVDPRDLLRGDYVSLSYEIERIPTAIVADLASSKVLGEDSYIFVRLAKEDDGYWRPISASLGQPGPAPGEGEVDIRGVLRNGWNIGTETSLRVTYGIDRYYVPEGEGLAIETNMRERPFGILAAIGPDGSAHIKALMDDQVPLYAEPPY